MSIHTPLPAVPDPDNQRRYDLIQAIFHALAPHCDDPFVCGGLYPRIIYKKFPSFFCGLGRDMALHFPADAVSAMIKGRLYTIEVPSGLPKADLTSEPVKFVASDLDSFQNWFAKTLNNQTI